MTRLSDCQRGLRTSSRTTGRNSPGPTRNRLRLQGPETVAMGTQHRHKKYNSCRCYKLSYAGPGFGRIIRDNREITLSLMNYLIHQALGRANAHKPANHQRGAVRDHADRFATGNGFHFDLQRWRYRNSNRQRRADERERNTHAHQVRNSAIRAAFAGAGTNCGRRSFLVF